MNCKIQRTLSQINGRFFGGHILPAISLMSAEASGDENDIYSSPYTEANSTDTGGAVLANPKTKDLPPGFADWAPCKKQAWLDIERNPNAFYYRHVDPNEKRKNGPWTEDEKQLFLKVLEEHPPEMGHWGLFSRHIPGRVGYQCNAYYKKLVAAGVVKGTLPATRGSDKDAAAARSESSGDIVGVITKTKRHMEIERQQAAERMKKDVATYPYLYSRAANDRFHFSNTCKPRDAFRDKLRAFIQSNRKMFTTKTDMYEYTL